MPTFDIQSALKAGYSQQEVNDFLRQKGNENLQTPGYSAPSQPFGSGFIGSLLNPVARYAGNALGALTEATRSNILNPLENSVNKTTDQTLALSKQLRAETDPLKKAAIRNQLAVLSGQAEGGANALNTVTDAQNPFLTTNQLSSFNSGTTGLSNILRQAQTQNSGLRQGLKDTANVASYAVPFGEGANIVTRALLPGAVAGGLQALSGENVSPESVATGAAVGGAGASLLHGILGAISGNTLQKAGQGIEKGGSGLIQSQYEIPRSIAKNLKLAETIPELSRYGIANINKVAEVAPQVTGQSGDITKAIREAVGGLKTFVNTSGIEDIATRLSEDPLIQVGQDSKFVNFIKKGLQELPDKASNNATKSIEANPANTFDFIQKLQKQANSIGGKSMQLTASEQALKNAYNSIADEMEQRLFVQAGADSRVALTKTPEVIGRLRAISPQLAEDFQNAKTVGDLRAIAKPFVRGSIAARETENAANLATKNLGGVAKGVGQIVQNPLNLAAIPLSSNTVNAGAGQMVANIGRGVQNVGKLVPNLSSVPALNQILMQGVSRGPSALGNNGIQPSQQSQQTTNNNYGNPQSGQQINNGQLVPSDANSTPSSGITKEQVALAQMLLPSTISERLKNAYETQLGTSQQQQLAFSKSRVAPAIDQLEALYNSGNISKGRIGGKLSQILGAAGFNPSVTNYEGARSAVAPLIARALGNLGNLTAQEQAAAIRLLPTAQSTPEEARRGFAQLKAMLGLQ